MEVLRMTADELSRIANRLRLDVVETVHAAGDGHPGPCMSIADIMAVLFFDKMKLDPANPRWPERDRFVLSKGHACPILYAALAREPETVSTPGILFMSGCPCRKEPRERRPFSSSRGK